MPHFHLLYWRYMLQILWFQNLQKSKNIYGSFLAFILDAILFVQSAQWFCARRQVRKEQ